MEQVSRTNLFKFPNVAVKKIHVFRALMDSIFGVLLCVFLIYDIDLLVMISTQEEKVCRTNLFQFGNVAVKKIYVFRGLTKSKLDAHFCVILIYHKEALCKFLDQLDKVSRNNLFEFSVSGIIGKFILIRHLIFFFFHQTLPKQ